MAGSSRKARQPLSEVRHLGSIAQFAGVLRKIPGLDLGAEEHRRQRLAVLEERRARSKGKGPSKEELEAGKAMEAEAEVQAEVTRLEMLYKQLKEQKKQLLAEQEESALVREALTKKNKRASKNESGHQEDLGDLLDENEELALELKNDQSRLEQDQVILKSQRQKIALINKELEETDRPKKSVLAGIKLKFGPPSPESLKEMPEHNREVDWFETSQLPKAILFQKKQHAESERKHLHSASRGRGKPRNSRMSPSMRSSASLPQTQRQKLAPMCQQTKHQAW
jgi:hypothetical protein